MSRFVINIGSAFEVMHRLHCNGRDALQSDLSTITWAIYPIGIRTAVASGSLTVADVVYDEIQTDGRWSTDDIGYNFRHTVAATAIDTPGGYKIEYIFIPSNAANTFNDVNAEVTARDVYSVV